MPIKGGGGVPSSLNEIGDVNTPSPSDNQVLSWDTASGTEAGISATGHTHTIDDLTDVTITSVSDNQILRFDTGGGVWQNETPPWLVDITSENFSTLADVTITAIASGEILKWNGSAWINNTLAEAGISATGHTHSTSFISALSDETSDLTTGIKVTFRMPFAFTVNEVRASLTTPATGATLLTVDINEGGTSILSTKITIDASEKTSETAATAPVISDSALADDAEITLEIDAVGNTTTGKGLKVEISGVPA